MEKEFLAEESGVDYDEYTSDDFPPEVISEYLDLLFLEIKQKVLNE